MSSNVPEPEDHRTERAKLKWKIALLALAGVVMLVISFLAGKAIREMINDNSQPAVGVHVVTTDET